MQSITKINTDQRAIVGETMYDYNGRPQIQMLPVPVKSNDLNYRPNFNLIEGTPDKARIEKSQYDIATEGNGCDVLAPKFKTDTGASNYYSPANHFDNDPANVGSKILNKNLIPDAKKYPYTQTYYTNDNTGRIAAQSGVGENHLINSGRETKYLYGSPDQQEISRLFGTDVGNSAHYKKNIVIDPNKQASISYLDMDGKVVATALAGKVPENLSELEGSKTRTIESGLLDSVSYALSKDFNTKEYISSFAVAEDADYTFAYNGTVGGYSFSCTDQKTKQVKTVNLSGVVDVEFKIIDKCKKTLISAFTTTNYSTTTSATQAINMPLTVAGSTIPGKLALKQGQYDVIKRVSINHQKLNDYWNYYSTSTQFNCVLTEDSVVKAEKNKIALEGCDVSCQACSTQVSKLLSNANVTLSDEEKFRIEHLCDNLCSDNAKCLSGLNPMIADMSKDGQYGKIRRDKVVQASINGPDKTDFEQNGVNYNGFEIQLQSTMNNGDAANPDDDKIDPSVFPMSIFNDNNRLNAPTLPVNSSACFSGIKPSWKKPIRVYFDDLLTSGTKTPSAKSFTNQVLFDGTRNFAGAKYEETNYMDPNGNVVLATVKLNADGITYTPAVDANAPVQVISAAYNIHKVPVKYLKHVQDFMPYWEGHFANYLVFYHPEYRYFVECTANQLSNAYERKLLSVSEKDDAKSKGLLDNTYIPKILTEDPLYANAGARQYLEYIYNNYQNGKPMHQVVTKSVDCPTGSDQCGAIPEATCYNGVINTDQKWVMLVGLYLAERQKYEHRKVTRVAVDKGFYNGCVGDVNFYMKEDARNFFYNPYQTAPIVNINVCRFRYWWWWGQEYGDPASCCLPVARDYWYFNYPIFDFAQTCNVWEYGLYSDKVRRFEPTGDMVNNGLSINEGNCTVTIPALNSEPSYTLETVCQSQVLDFIDKGTRAAEAIKYEKCGLCPVANDLEQFLIGIKKKAFFSNNTEKLVTCTNNADFVGVGGALQKQFHNATNTGYPQVYWTGSLDNTGKILTGTLRNSLTGISKTIMLTIPAAQTKTFADISFCCLSASETNSNAFSLEATYFNAVQNQKVEFNIAGTINVNLTSCQDFPPICNATSKASQVANILNTLVLSSTSGQTVNKDKQLQLASATDYVALDANAVRAVYEPAVRNLINKTELNSQGTYPEDFATLSPKWFATKDAGQALNGKITLSNTSINQIDVVITPTTAGSITNYNDIVRFTNVRPYSDLSCTGNKPKYCENTKFVADAVFMSGGVKTLKEVTIQVAQLTMSICKPVVFVKQ